MTDNEIIEALECCISSNTALACFKCPMVKNKECNGSNKNVNELVVKNAIDLIKQQQAEIKQLETIERFATKTIEKQTAEIERLNYIIMGIMHSVDKWLDGDELKQDEVNRAITMREKTLQITEKQQAEIERLEEKIKRLGFEKQIPKKPIANKVKAEKVKVGNGWWCKGTTIHKCPICDEYAGRTSKYCNQCGQALDWSDTE